MLTPEQMQKLRAKLSLDASVPDEQVMDVASEHVLAAIDVQQQAKSDAAKVTSLSADVARLKKELDAAEAKVLTLSAEAPKELDPRLASMIRRNFKAAEDRLIDSGVVAKAGVEKLSKLFGVNEQNGLALSATVGGAGEDAELLYDQVLEVIAANPGIKTNGAVQRARSLALSATANDGPMSEDRRKALLGETPLGQAALATK